MTENRQPGYGKALWEERRGEKPIVILLEEREGEKECMGENDERRQ